MIACWLLLGFLGNGELLGVICVLGSVVGSGPSRGYQIIERPFFTVEKRGSKLHRGIERLKFYQKVRLTE